MPLLRRLIFSDGRAKNGGRCNHHPFLNLKNIGGPIIGGGAYLIFKWLPEKENEKIIEKQGVLHTYWYTITDEYYVYVY